MKLGFSTANPNFVSIQNNASRIKGVPPSVDEVRPEG
jgi:hypothetical protein